MCCVRRPSKRSSRHGCPGARRVVVASGLAEAACAVALFRRWSWAGSASAALLVAVLPGNVQMALHSTRTEHQGWAKRPLVAWLRLPLQIPLIWAALQARQRRQPTSR